MSPFGKNRMEIISEQNKKISDIFRKLI